MRKQIRSVLSELSGGLSKKFWAAMLLLVVGLAALVVWVPTALAWHVLSVSATVQCDQAKGYYVIPKPTINQNPQFPGAEVTDWTPKTLPGNTAVATTVTVSVRWSSGETQNPKPTVKVYPDGKCATPPPEVKCDTNAFGGGWTQIGVIGNTVYCVRETTNTVTVDREVEKIVPGPPAPCPDGTTRTLNGACIAPPLPPEKITVTKFKNRPPLNCQKLLGKNVRQINAYTCLKEVERIKKIHDRPPCPPPPVCPPPPSYDWVWDGKKWVCAPKANG